MLNIISQISQILISVWEEADESLSLSSSLPAILTTTDLTHDFLAGGGESCGCEYLSVDSERASDVGSSLRRKVHHGEAPRWSALRSHSISVRWR